MKKIIRIILGLLLVGLIGFGIYKFFFDCQKVNTEFAKYFTLQEMDYAVIGDEVTLKLLAIYENKCLDNNCDYEGQDVVKFLIMNEHEIAYIKLGTLEESKKTVKDTDYAVELIRVDEKGATLEVTKK